MKQLPDSWQELLNDELSSDYYLRLAEFVDTERREHPQEIFPDDEQVFQAFELTSPDQVKILILGQDPYPTRGHAHGLAFSVLPKINKLPPSLKNIFRELNQDLSIPVPSSGYLYRWAQQGVLLLNSILTVRQSQPNSHQQRGWERLTDAVIARLAEQDQPIVFVLWGKLAQQKRTLIQGERHAIIQSPHPSPLSARTGFWGSRPFSRINEQLKQWGREPIDWRLD